MALFADLLGNLLVYAPEKRLNVKAALQHEWLNFNESS
jgi:serine/threonine protein kinase